MGPGEVEIGPKGLQIFLLKKFNKILSDVDVSFPNQRLLLSGHVTFLSGPTPFTATGLLKARDGRFIDLIDPDFRFNGVPLNSITTALLLKQINPVLDAETDLRIGNFFTMTDVTIGERSLTVHGRFTIPKEDRR